MKAKPYPRGSMVLLVFFIPYVFMGFILPLCDSREVIDEGNFVVALQRKATEMERLASVLRDEQRWPNEELSTLVVHANMTDLEVVRKLLSKEARFSAELEGKVFLTCLDDTKKVLKDLERELAYAWQMRAAYGKREKLLNSLYTWNTAQMGQYDICKSVERDNLYVPMETLYCTEYFFTASGIFSRGVCVPASCSNDDLFVIHNAIYNMLGIGQNFLTAYSCIRETPWTWDAIFVTCLLGFFAIVVIIGTFYDVVFRRRRLGVAKEDPPMKETSKENGIEKGQYNYGLELKESKNIDDSSFSIDESSESQSHGNSFMTSEEEEADEEETAAKEEVEKKTNNLIPGCKNKFGELLTSWSLIYNSEKIVSVKKSSSSLSSLNGIRVLSMLWIIWGHSNQFTLYYVTDNLRYFYEDVLTGYGYNATLFATFSVDSFFVLSGLLVTYLALKELKERKGKLNWFLYYFHRIWRLTPTYMIAIGIYVSLVIHMGYGPTKEENALYDKEFCKKYWWTNLIYINNLYPFPGRLGGCMGWSWYLANDMQFYIICPLFILLLFYRNKLGVSSVVAMCASSCIVTGALTAYYGLPVGKSDHYYNDRMESIEEWGTGADVVYGKPYCRIQSYMVGVFVGYLIFRHMHVRKIRIHWIVNIVGWIVGIGLMYSMVFSLHYTSTENPSPQWFSAVWGGLSRTVFSMGVAWVAFACSTGHGGLINSFLSWSFWTPMARLTYCAYLLHPIVISLFLQAKMVPIHWSAIEMTYFFLANTVMSYFAAFCLSLLVEGPTMGLEKVFIRRKR